VRLSELQAPARMNSEMSGRYVKHVTSMALLMATHGCVAISLLGLLEALFVALREFYTCVGQPKKSTCSSSAVTICL
jgi:hypothetical protein